MSIHSLMHAHRPFLTDGGLETYMVFDEGLDLPSFASFTLLGHREGEAAISRYFERFFELARKAQTGFVLDTLTWRANLPWGQLMGIDPDEIAAINTRAVAYAKDLRAAYGSEDLPILINGVVGPSGDGYDPASQLSGEIALAVHLPQIRALAEADVDLITAMTITHSGEAIGVARAAQIVGKPVVISFTLETDGKLPSGETLEDAITKVDAASEGYPLYFMINCAHPDHFAHLLSSGAAFVERLGGMRANASRMSHAELDVAEVLDSGDPDELGGQYGELIDMLPNLRVVGGCCGTDHRHVGCIAGHTHQAEAD